MRGSRITVLLMALLAVFRGSPVQSESERPNILMILADDLGRELLSMYGGQSNYQTPNLEKLAQEGMLFNTCYATPMCVPTRVELLTGRYSFRNYMAWEAIDRSEWTYPQLLKAVGYKTAMAGKWHPHGQWNLDPVPPIHAGFDEYCSYDSVAMGEQARAGRGNRFWGGTIIRNGESVDLDRYGPDVYSDFLVDFIERNQDGPFLAYYAMTSMHRPFQPTPDHPDAPVPGQPAPSAWMGAQGKTENFAPMLAYADKMVGKMLEKINELGIAENTLVVFAGDNGTDNHAEAKAVRTRYRDEWVAGGKYYPTELGVNVPLLVRWPGRIAAGSICDALVDMTDFLPTFCQVAGAALPEGYSIDGRSLVPALLGQATQSKEIVLTWGNYENNSSKYKDPSNNTDKLVDAARGNRFKLYSDGRLYDVLSDPLEREPIYPGVDSAADGARGRLEASMRQLRDSQPRRW